MKPMCLLVLLLLANASFPQVKTSSIKHSKEAIGSAPGFVYSLPYKKGKSFLLVQGYQSNLFSHRREFALDFKMKKGTEICAARNGIVVAVKEDSKKSRHRVQVLVYGKPCHHKT